MDVFVDTSGWASFFLRSERFHSPAETLMRQWQKQGRRVVTTNYVLTELIALFMSPLRVSRPTAIRYVETVLVSSWVEIVHIDATLHTAAWSLMKARADRLSGARIPLARQRCPHHQLRPQVSDGVGWRGGGGRRLRIAEVRLAKSAVRR